MPDPNQPIAKTAGQLAAEARIAERAAESKSAAQSPLDDICRTYGIAMVRTRQHIGEGNEGWSEPLCPRIHQLGGKGCVCKGEVADALVTSEERNEAKAAK